MNKKETKNTAFQLIFKCSCGSESFTESNGDEIILICKKCGNTFIEVK